MDGGQKKVVLITGAARRIGAALARYLASQSLVVAVHYRRSAREAERLEAEIVRSGGTCRLYAADLTDEQRCRNLIQSVYRDLERLDFLVNNAAVFEADRLERVDIQRARWQVWINAWVPLVLMQEFATVAGRGAVVNLLDSRLQWYDPEHFSYCTSKRLLAEFTRLAALTFAPRVRVNAVAPGAVLPPRTTSQGYVPAGDIPLGRRPRPEEIARAVHFLLVEPSITGQVLFVDGGQHLHGG